MKLQIWLVYYYDWEAFEPLKAYAKESDANAEVKRLQETDREYLRAQKEGFGYAMGYGVKAVPFGDST